MTWLTGVVVGGVGTGESVENLAAAVHGVKNAVGSEVPVLVQGMDSLQEVCSMLIIVFYIHV